MYFTTLRFPFTILILFQATSQAARLPVDAPQHIITYSPRTSDIDADVNLDPKPISLKVPGESPANYCSDSDPSNDIFQIRRLDFLPTNPRVGFYQTVRFIGRFASETGEFPWLSITGSFNGSEERFLWWSPLCDIDVFQDVSVPTPEGDYRLGAHRSCPPAIAKGYAEILSPPMPLYPAFVPLGNYTLRAEATTQDGRRIFCVEGTVEVTD